MLDIRHNFTNQIYHAWHPQNCKKWNRFFSNYFQYNPVFHKATHVPATDYDCHYPFKFFKINQTKSVQVTFSTRVSASFPVKVYSVPVPWAALTSTIDILFEY